jgi:hypothetical protein
VERFSLEDFQSDSNRSELWSRIYRLHNVRHVAEVGVWKGAFAASILSQCDFISSYYMVDPWRPLPDWNKPLNGSVETLEDAYAQAMTSVAFAEARTVVLRGTTREVSDQIPDGSLDAVYVDGDHTLRGITIDLIRMIKKLKPGGLLGGDDFFADPWHHGLKYEPTLVAPFATDFAEAMELPIWALPFNQYLLINEPNGFSFTNLSGVKHSRRVGHPEFNRCASDFKPNA